MMAGSSALPRASHRAAAVIGDESHLLCSGDVRIRAREEGRSQRRRKRQRAIRKTLLLRSGNAGGRAPRLGVGPNSVCHFAIGRGSRFLFCLPWEARAPRQARLSRTVPADEREAGTRREHELRLRSVPRNPSTAMDSTAARAPASPQGDDQFRRSCRPASSTSRGPPGARSRILSKAPGPFESLDDVRLGGSMRSRISAAAPRSYPSFEGGVLRSERKE
jgi:hypothetical protein